MRSNDRRQPRLRSDIAAAIEAVRTQLREAQNAEAAAAGRLQDAQRERNEALQVQGCFPNVCELMGCE